MKRCSFCQTVAQSDTQKFCTKCGRPFPVIPAPETPAPDGAVPAAVPAAGSAGLPEPGADAPAHEAPTEPLGPPPETVNLAAAPEAPADAAMPPEAPPAPPAPPAETPVQPPAPPTPPVPPAGVPVPPVPPAAPPAPPVRPMPPVRPVPPNKGKSKLFIVLIVCVAIVVVLLGVVAFLVGSRVGRGTGSLFGSGDDLTESLPYEPDTAVPPEDRTDTDTAGPDGGTQSGEAVLPTPVPTPTPMPTPTPAPTPVAPAVATDTTVVVRNALPDGRLLVDGYEVPFRYVGSDIVIERSILPDVCQVRLIAEVDGAYQTAAVWFNEDYGHELSFAADYGGYVDCDVNGLARPSEKVIEVLIWAYHYGFLQSINEQSASYMRYSTAANTEAERDHIFSAANSQNTYDLNDFSALLDAGTVQYNADGTVLFNASFRSEATNRATGAESTVNNHKTMEIIWEDGMWKINRLAFLNDNDFNAGRYADFS